MGPDLAVQIAAAGDTAASGAARHGGARPPPDARGGGARTRPTVAKMASHVIFQYSILAIDGIHNTWTNICVKMIIIRLIGTRDEKIQNFEEIRSKGPRQR